MESSAQNMLWECAVNSNLSALKKLLNCGVDPNVADENGEPLMFAVIVNGDLESLRMLLAYCDINTENADGRSPLMLAVEMDDIEIIKTLIKAGLYISSYSKGKNVIFGI
jgi:ankyrin repeat protein